jgi:hypothetical protein
VRNNVLAVLGLRRSPDPSGPAVSSPGITLSSCPPMASASMWPRKALSCAFKPPGAHGLQCFFPVTLFPRHYRMDRVHPNG